MSRRPGAARENRADRNSRQGPRESIADTQRLTMKQAMNKKLCWLRLDINAIELRDHYGLRRNRQGLGFLRHSLRLGLLKNIEKRNVGKNQKLSIKVLENAVKIESTLLSSTGGLVPLDEALAIHHAAQSIISTAANEGLNGKWRKETAALQKSIDTLEESEGRMEADPKRKRRVDRARLFAVANLADGILRKLMPKKGYFVKTGFSQIDAISKWAFTVA